MTEAERDHYIAIFDQAAATPAEGHDAEWLWLISEVLKLPICYLPAAQEALRQGRWRNARNPKVYLKTVAQREAIRLGLAPDPREGQTLNIPTVPELGRPMSQDEYIDYRSYDGPVKEAGVWRARPSWDDEGDELVPRFKGRSVPQDLLVPEDDEPDARMRIDWNKVADRASLDPEERLILQLRLGGFTRDFVLTRAENEEERRAVQAAWRRLDRHMDTVREVLGGRENKDDGVLPGQAPKKNPSKNVPRIECRNTR